MKRFWRHIIILTLAVLVLSVPPVVSATLSDDLLRIHATLLPKTILMDYKFKQKLAGNTILIHLLCRSANNFSAHKLRRYIQDKYKDGINGMPVDVSILNYDEVIGQLPPASLYYLFPAAPGQITSALKKIQPQERLVFAYDPEDLQYGAQIGLHIGRKIKPILNVDALKAGGITLRPALIKISELYYQGKQLFKAGE
jgi:hypothetical protein